MNAGELTHLDPQGHAHMVDVGQKKATRRTASARGEVHLRAETLALLRLGNLKKGDALAAARIAGIMAAKRTAELIPLCHPLALDQVTVDFRFAEELPGVEITVTASAYDRTGVEMEALTGVAVAALTIYDMVKAVEKTARIQNIRLVRKTGGRSGDVVNP